jgi:hypothetical protein
MNGCWLKYSTTAAAAVAIVSLIGGRTLAEPSPPAAAPPAVAGALSDAAKPAALPSFASIPPAPTDVRPFRAWQSAIADTRHVGAETAATAAAEPWTLSDTQGFADRARAEAAPPPPMTTPAAGDTDAFIREMMRRATPPPRAH